MNVFIKGVPLCKYNLSQTIQTFLIIIYDMIHDFFSGNLLSELSLLFGPAVSV